ncbi:MAG: PII uridylyl-transferase [Syntrophus sp. PtaB.Bin075]|nr:MAG: PII uridylyl-transferase [Syntrophus sp. PtaB.Bin075]
MSIPEQYENRCVYHFTHIDNLPGILKYGLLSTNEKKRLGIEHTAIAYNEIQGRRSCMDVPCGCAGVVHDYVPLYFCKLSLMLLAVVTNKIADQPLIIHFQFPIGIMNQYPCVFTDASANTAIPPLFYDDFCDLVQLNWEAIDSMKWSMPSDALKQARQAELLIYKKVDISSISRIIVWNDSVKEEVLTVYKEANISPPPVSCDRYHYYIDFYETNRRSIVTGPFFTKKAYLETVKKLLQEINGATSPQFKNLPSLLEDGLKENFGCLPETGELIGLQTDNIVHKGDVGTHTLQVVEELLKLKEFASLNRTDCLLVEIAAYLHDIGKGPKSRWADYGGRQKVDHDHPLKALPMLYRILTEEIETMKSRSAEVICKLVCYHDLIGDIIGKGRRIEELIDVVEDERELNMLIALGKADMLAITPTWSNDDKIEDVRKQVIKALQSEAPDE